MGIYEVSQTSIKNLFSILDFVMFQKCYQGHSLLFQDSNILGYLLQRIFWNLFEEIVVEVFESLHFCFVKETGFFGNTVGNKAEGRISKRLFQENKTRQIFRKTNISYPLIGTRRLYLD